MIFREIVFQTFINYEGNKVLAGLQQWRQRDDEEDRESVFSGSMPGRSWIDSGACPTFSSMPSMKVLSKSGTHEWGARFPSQNSYFHLTKQNLITSIYVWKLQLFFFQSERVKGMINTNGPHQTFS